MLVMWAHMQAAADIVMDTLPEGFAYVMLGAEPVVFRGERVIMESAEMTIQLADALAALTGDVVIAAGSLTLNGDAITIAAENGGPLALATTGGGGLTLSSSGGVTQQAVGGTFAIDTGAFVFDVNAGTVDITSDDISINGPSYFSDTLTAGGAFEAQSDITAGNLAAADGAAGLLYEDAVTHIVTVSQ